MQAIGNNENKLSLDEKVSSDSQESENDSEELSVFDEEDIQNASAELEHILSDSISSEEAESEDEPNERLQLKDVSAEAAITPNRVFRRNSGKVSDLVQFFVFLVHKSLKHLESNFSQLIVATHSLFLLISQSPLFLVFS